MQLSFRLPDDFHVHLRNGEMLRRVIPYTIRSFGRALVMPNLPAIDTVAKLVSYRQEIMGAVYQLTSGSLFHPLMTVKLSPELSPEMIRLAWANGAVAGKLYPDGVTTAAHGGVRIEDLDRMGPIFDTMQECGMVLCWHGEHPSSEVYYEDAEKEMLWYILRVIDSFPRLKQVIEHISTQEAVEMVLRAPDRVAATITVHHLYLTGNDIVGRGQYYNPGGKSKLHPHHFCWPMAKRPEHRAVLRSAAISGNPKFFLGTDSAPWLITDKLGAFSVPVPGCGCAGIFSTPVVLPALLSLFVELDAVPRLEGFMSEYGARFYGLELNEGQVTLEQCQWLVDDTVCRGMLVPFLSGTTLPWKLVE